MEEAKNTGEEQIAEKPKIIAEANLAAERMEKANIEKAKLLALEQQIIVERRLGGSTSAGQQQPKPVEETPKDYAKRVMNEKIPKALS